MKNGGILRGFRYFYHQTVTTKQIEDYLSKQAELICQWFFNQYLEIPNTKLEYAVRITN
jgi:3-phenylpropionate/cinnamic acid dioxygenase small subunit